MTTPSHHAASLPSDTTIALGKRFVVERVVPNPSACFRVLAKERETNSPVLLQILRPEHASSDDVVGRFLQAGRLAANIDSELIARPLEVGRLEGTGAPYWLGERLAGDSLRVLLDLHGPVRPSVAVDYVLLGCRALRAAHRGNVIHGRLEPSGWFRVQLGGGGVSIKLLDFGLAIAVQREATRGASLPPDSPQAGPEYRSPELVAGTRRIEPTVDVWGIGVVLYELVTGRHPFASATTRAAFSKAVAAGPAPLGLGPNRPFVLLEELLRECLRKDASQRPHDVEAVTERLTAIRSRLTATPATLEGRPIGAAEAAGPARPEARRASSRPPASSGRPRFMGPALGNVGVRDGGYSMAGRGVVTSEQPMPRSSRRPARSGATRGGAAARPHRAVADPRQEETGDDLPRRRSTRPPPKARGSEPPRRARIPTNPATPRALGSQDDREEPTSATDTSAAPRPAPPPEVSVPERARFGLSTFDPEAGPAADTDEAPAAAARSAARDDAPDIEVAADDSELEELDFELDDGTGQAVPTDSEPAPTRDVAASPDAWELDLSIPRPIAIPAPGEGPAHRPSLPPPKPTAPPAAESAPPAAESAPVTPAAPAAPVPVVEHADRFGPFLLEPILWADADVERHPAVRADDPRARLQLDILRGDGSPYLPRLEQLDRLRRAAAHPNLLGSQGVGVVEGSVYAAHDWVEGTDLRRLLDFAAGAGEPLGAAVAAFVVRRVAAGLDALLQAMAASATPIARCHGDIRPSNICLSIAGDVKLGPPAPLTDWRGIPAGKVDYQSPEELVGEPVDRASDLFVLGIVLGEMLLGKPLLAGSGLECLLALQQLDLAPWHEQSGGLPDGLRRVCDKALARSAADRFASAAALADALAPFETGEGAGPVERLRGWVARERAAGAGAGPTPSSHGARERVLAATLPAPAARTAGAPTDEAAARLRVRRAHSGLIGQLSAAGLMEAVATGSLGPDDEVTWQQGAFRRIREVEPLARLLMASAPSLEPSLLSRLAADHTYLVRDTPMLDVLAQMRQCYATGLLFAERLGDDSNRRTEILLREGRVLTVRSSEPGELLGEMLVRHRKLSRPALDDALASLEAYAGRLGNALVARGSAEGNDLFRAIRAQAATRIAATFGWTSARASVYLSYRLPRVPFPLDLDLTHAMIRGVLVSAGDDPAHLLPGMMAQLEPGARFPGLDRASLDGVPVALRVLVQLVGSRLVVANALRAVESQAHVSTAVACACIVVARSLRWIAVRMPGS